MSFHHAHTYTSTQSQGSYERDQAIYIRTKAYKCAHTHAHTNTHSHTCAHKHVQTQTGTHANTHTYAHTIAHSYGEMIIIHTCTYTHPQTRTHATTHTRNHAHAQTHTNTHIKTRTLTLRERAEQVEVCAAGLLVEHGRAHQRRELRVRFEHVDVSHVWRHAHAAQMKKAG